MKDEEKPGEDLYSRIDYRRMVAWPERIRRESPFLTRCLERAPERSLLDLGCGTGEHSRFFAELGFRVLGVDSSQSMLAKALETPLPENLAFRPGDLGKLRETVSEPFGAAISLGNTLPHLTEREDLGNLFSALGEILLPGGVFIFQILNYERVFKQGIRWLPLNFRDEEEGGEVVFLRLMQPLPEGRVRFCPSTLRFDPSAEPPLRVVRSKIVELRGWTLVDLEPLLQASGLSIFARHGDMHGGEFLADASQDLVVVAAKG